MKFAITSKAKSDLFVDNVSKGDSKTYEIDLTAWQEANHTINTAVWAVEHGNCGVSNQALSAGVASALISFPESGKNLISLIVTTNYEVKKIWLELRAWDKTINFINSDYN